MSTRADSHLPALDGVRGIAVMMVVALHFVPLSGISSWGHVGRVIECLTTLGGIGVDVFFVLSGFLITGILLRTRRGPGYFSHFYLRRSLRIFPLYYFALAVTFFVIPALHIHDDHSFAARNQEWLWLYGTNFLSAYSGQTLAANGVTLNHFWSLAVEEQFYLVWPAVIYFCRSRKQVAAIAVAMIAFAFVARAVEIPRVGMRAVNMLTWCRFDALAVGALLCVASQHERIWNRVQRPLVVLGVVAGVLYVLYGIVACYTTIGGSARVSFLLFPLQLLIGGAMVAHALAPGPHGALTHPVLVWLGQRSYGIYVYHGMIRIAFAAMTVELAASLGPSSAAPIALVIGLAATFAISELSFRLLESPLNRLKRHFGYGSTTT